VKKINKLGKVADVLNILKVVIEEVVCAFNQRGVAENLPQTGRIPFTFNTVCPSTCSA
jgi:hypothetical protein